MTVRPIHSVSASRSCKSACACGFVAALEDECCGSEGECQIVASYSRRRRSVFIMQKRCSAGVFVCFRQRSGGPCHCREARLFSAFICFLSFVIVLATVSLGLFSFDRWWYRSLVVMGTMRKCFVGRRRMQHCGIAVQGKTLRLRR